MCEECGGGGCGVVGRVVWEVVWNLYFLPTDNYYEKFGQKLDFEAENKLWQDRGCVFWGLQPLICKDKSSWDNLFIPAPATPRKMNKNKMHQKYKSV